MILDCISDLHLDFWKEERVLIEGILPDDPADAILIAGDLGHSNVQNERALRMLRQNYPLVLWVHGNHDLYVGSGGDSSARLADMIDRSKRAGATYLRGDIVEVDGVRIGGCGMWYDSSYARERFGYTKAAIDRMWKRYLNDAKDIRIEGKPIDYDRQRDEEYALLERLVDCDVIMTHVPPLTSRLPPHYRIPESTFFQFDSREFRERCAAKLWLFGHTHTPYDFLEEGRRYLCNPIGYPSERTTVPRMARVSI